MLSPDVKSYIDGLKPKANTISDAHLKELLTVAGWGSDVFDEAIDYFRSPSEHPKMERPVDTSPAQSPLKKIVFPESVMKELKRDANVFEADGTTERRPNTMQWFVIVVVAMAISVGAYVVLQQNVPNAFLGARHFFGALNDINTLVALVPAALLGLLSILVSGFLGRRAYRSRGRVVLSFLYGVSVNFVFLLALYAFVRSFTDTFAASVSTTGSSALSRLIGLVDSAYVFIFFVAFILGTLVLMLSYMVAIPVVRSFVYRAGGQVWMIACAAVIASVVSNVWFLPAQYMQESRLCALILKPSLKEECRTSLGVPSYNF